MTTSFWYGVFWPYFQFAVFVAFLIYVARKPINQYLESKRDDFRTKLSEAREALTLAERKIKEYETQIATLVENVEAIKDQHLQDAEFEKTKIIAEANQTAESILNDAKRATHELISQTQDELKADMFKLVLVEFEKQLTPERLAKLEIQLQQEAVRSIPQALSPTR